MGCCQTVPNDKVAVVQRCGKFERTAPPGLLCLPFPCVQTRAGDLSLRVQETTLTCETKTKDNVFVSINVAVQFVVIREKIYEAFYRLRNPVAQMNAYVFDVVRSTAPRMLLDEVFESRDDIAKQVKSSLQKTMNEYGYYIQQVLVTDITPDARVRNAMNEINASRRLRMAAAEKAEAEKIVTVKQAEAESESKYLQGCGIARQRKAIVDGLRDSVSAFQSSVKGCSSRDVLEMILLTQYFDAVKDVGTQHNTRTVFIQSSEGSNQDALRNTLLMAR